MITKQNLFGRPEIVEGQRFADMTNKPGKYFDKWIILTGQRR